MMRNVAKGDMDLDMVAATANVAAIATAVYVLCLPFGDRRRMISA